MIGDNVVFGQLVQKLEQITPNSSALQDDQNEWSQSSIWTAGSKVGDILGFRKSASAGQGFYSITYQLLLDVITTLSQD